MSKHTTHFDDCGCKSAGYEAEIAELRAALDDLVKTGYMVTSDKGDQHFVVRVYDVKKLIKEAS